MNTDLRITIMHLRKTFKNEDKAVNVLDDINYEFSQGIGYGIQGISGVGKTTFLNIIAGLDQPTSGSVLYNRYDIHSFKHRAFPQASVGLIFQEPHLLQELTVLENVMIKGLINKQAPDEKAALALLTLVKLPHKASAYPHQLSGGEQQRVSIARALYNKPQVLIADEPTAHLDQLNKQLILELLLEFKVKHKVGLLISTHDPLVANAMDTVMELQKGKLVMIKES